MIYGYRITMHSHEIIILGYQTPESALAAAVSAFGPDVTQWDITPITQPTLIERELVD